MAFINTFRNRYNAEIDAIKSAPLLPGDPDHRDPICAEYYSARVGSY